MTKLQRFKYIVFALVVLTHLRAHTPNPRSPLHSGEEHDVAAIAASLHPRVSHVPLDQVNGALIRVHLRDRSDHPSGPRTGVCPAGLRFFVSLHFPMPNNKPCAAPTPNKLRLSQHQQHMLTTKSTKCQFAFPVSISHNPCTPKRCQPKHTNGCFLFQPRVKLLTFSLIQAKMTISQLATDQKSLKSNVDRTVERNEIPSRTKVTSLILSFTKPA